MLNARVTRRGFGRTLLTGGVAIAALFGSMATSGGATPATTSQEAPAAPYIDDGKASGRGGVLTIAPSTGALQLALGAGEVIAETAGSLAQAQSQAADLGLIGGVLSAEPCNGGDPVVPAERLPQALQVDNRAGPASADGAELPIPIPGLAGGHKQVEASTTPSSRAVVTFADIGVPGLVTVRGGQAIAEAEVFPGAGREGRAGVVIDLDILGIIQLNGLRWEARHRTGGEDAAEGQFTIDTAAVPGFPSLSLRDAEAVVAALNGVLVPFGIRIELPTVQRVHEGTVDFVRVTPLRIHVSESLASPLFREALVASQTFRSEVYGAIAAVDCRLSGIPLVTDVVLGVFAGTGSLTVDIGGVEATSATVVVEDLFGQFGGLPPAVPPVGDPPLAAPVSEGSAGGVTGSITPAAPVAPAPVATRPASSSQGPLDLVCENVHPNRKPSCSEGAAAAVGLVGLAATVGVGALDLRRRRRFLAPTGVAS